jgi:hypothetical protein
MTPDNAPIFVGYRPHLQLAFDLHKIIAFLYVRRARQLPAPVSSRKARGKTKKRGKCYTVPHSTHGVVMFHLSLNYIPRTLVNIFELLSLFTVIRNAWIKKGPGMGKNRSISLSRGNSISSDSSLTIQLKLPSEEGANASMSPIKVQFRRHPILTPLFRLLLFSSSMLDRTCFL